MECRFIRILEESYQYVRSCSFIRFFQPTGLKMLCILFYVFFLLGSCPCVATGTSPPDKLIFFHDNSQLCNEIFFFASIFDSGGWTIVPKQNKGAVVPVLAPQLYFRDAHENNQIMIYFFL
jgi:hypothetical protein